MVFLPFKDDNPLKFIWFQFTTLALILINVIVFIWQDSLGEKGLVSVAMLGGVVPTNLLGDAKLPAELMRLPPEATLVTYMFLHGDWWHLAGNMLFLWVFGDNVEDAMGSIRFLIFYLLSGAAAGLAHAYANLDSAAPLIGASGATAGVIGAYIMLYPRVKVWSLVFMRLPLKLPAFWIIASWILIQFLFVFLSVEDGTAWFAHIGGFIAGILLVVLFKRRSFDPHVPRRSEIRNRNPLDGRRLRQEQVSDRRVSGAREVLNLFECRLCLAVLPGSKLWKAASEVIGLDPCPLARPSEKGRVYFNPRRHRSRWGAAHRCKNSVARMVFVDVVGAHYFEKRE